MLRSVRRKRRIGVKDFLDRSGKQARDVKREWETRVVSPSLDCINSLSRNAQPIRQLSLTPISLGAENPEIVLHW